MMISAKRNTVQANLIKPQNSTRLRHSLAVLWRILLACLGGYLCTVAIISLIARLCHLAFGWAFSTSLLGTMQLSFLLYSVLILLVIASKRLLTTSLWLIVVTTLSASLNYWLAQGGPV